VGDVIGASLGWNSNSRGAEACLVSRGRRCRGCPWGVQLARRRQLDIVSSAGQVKDVRACIATAILRPQMQYKPPCPKFLFR
jgi:hypothetical protein